MSSIGFKKLTENALLPSRGSHLAAGIDLKSPYEVTVEKRGKTLILTDLSVQLPPNCYGRIASRSGLALNNFIEVAGGVIDSDYTGNVGIILYNHSDTDYVVKRGDRVAQLICELIVRPKICEVFNTKGYISRSNTM